MRLLDLVTRTVFGIASVALMLLAAALIIYAGVQVVAVFRQAEANVGSTLLEAVGSIEQPDVWNFGFGCLSHFGRAC